MLRLCCAAFSGQEKTPAARRQTRERVGGELDSADTLGNYEDRGAEHGNTLGSRTSRTNIWARMS